MNKIKLYQNLSKVKAEIGKISKDSTNPFYKSKYFDVNSLLEHVEPLLQKNGLVLLQPIENGIVQTVIVNIEDGESVSSGVALPNQDDPQKLGSAITYYRRYTLQGFKLKMMMQTKHLISQLQKVLKNHLPKLMQKICLG